MKRPLLQLLARPLSLLVWCAAYALLCAFAFSRLVPVPYAALAADAFLHALIFAALGYFLYKSVRYGNYVELEFYQRIINYLALGLLTVVVWLGLGLPVSYFIIGKEHMGESWNMLPMKAIIGIFTYVLVVQLVHHWLDKQRNEPDEEEEPVSEIPDSDSKVTEVLDRVVIKSGQKIHVINVEDILYIQSDGDYVQLHTAQNHFLKEETMKYYENNLPPAMFVRVHRSYIVNVEKILRVELYEKRNQMLILANGHKIKASAAGYKLLREALNL
ncbi:MAG: LytTR family DNA-binding domain-containing protein [Bacteroidia bacterium]|nr:LytTR family DNA-binding domain-containing protein [Bacteroidia bacterium]